MSETLSKSPYEYCRELVQRDDSARYQTTLFAPASAQPALWALYAFNQEVAKTRENVSEPMLGEIRLQWWRDVLDEIRAGTVREHPVARAAEQFLNTPDVLLLLEQLIDARAMDLYADGPANQKALLEYADRVGGGLSEAALWLSIKREALPGDTKGAITAVRASGAAWAMLGLVRAIPFHWAQNRSFLPGAAGQTATAQTSADKMYVLAEPIISDMLNMVRKKLAVSQENVRAYLPKAARHVCLLNAQAALYLAALAKVDDNPFKLVEPSDLTKLWVQAKQYWFR